MPLSILGRAGSRGPAVRPTSSLALALAAIDALCDVPTFDAAVARRALRMAVLANARRADLALGEARELLAVVVHTAGRGAAALGLSPEEVEALIEPAPAAPES